MKERQILSKIVSILVMLTIFILVSVTLNYSVKNDKLDSVNNPDGIFESGDSEIIKDNSFSSSSDGESGDDLGDVDDGLVGEKIITEDAYVLQKNADLASYTIIEYLGVSANITIPSSYKGFPITRIYDMAFYDNKYVQRLTIPTSITKIGEYAFEGCDKLVYNEYNGGNYLGTANNPYYYFDSISNFNLEEISLHEDTYLVGSYGFEDANKIKSIIVGDKVTNIGYGAFGKCSTIESLDLPYVGERSKGTKNAHFGYVFGSRTIGGHISYVPESLKTLIIRGGERIIKGALYGVDSLESLTLPYLGGNVSDNTNAYLSFVFGGDSADESIMPQTLTDVTILGGRMASQNAFYMASHLKSIDIDNVIATSIDNCTFDGCSSLMSITLPEGVTSIRYSAFSGCSSLESITLPQGVTSIGQLAFSGCSSLTSITLPEGVTSISSSMFSGCSSLTNITLPKGITSIGSSAFRDCSSLTSITLPEGVTSIGHYAFSGCSLLTNITLPEGITSIGDEAFYGCSSLTNITLPEGITSIGSSTFDGCSSLTNITLPEGVTSIGQYAFDGCSSLTNITLPEGVTSICDWAFSGCSSLTSITLPKGVTSIGDHAFYGCSSLTSITLPEEITSICDWAFYGCSSLTSITLPKGVTSIGQYAFFGCSSLTNITLPEGITSIGSYAFDGCRSLTSITLPEGVTDIGSGAFLNCSLLYIVENKSDLPITLDNGSSYGNVTSNAKVLIDKEGNKHYRSGITEFEYVDTADDLLFVKENGKYKLIAYLGEEETVTLPRDIQGNDYSIYHMLGVKKVIIPEGVTSIGAQAFYGCRSLTSITLPEGITSIGEYAFYGCRSLTSITLPEGVTRIGTQAFEGCSSLTSITLPEGVTSIGLRTFSGCSSLTNITLPEGITSIGLYAFDGCSSLTNITLPNSITSIGRSAFDGCSSLTSITLPEGLTTIESSAFKDTGIESIVIPSTITHIAVDTFAGCNIREFKVDSNNQYLTTINGIVYDKDVTHYVFVPTVIEEIIVPSTITNLSLEGNSNIKKVTFAPNTKITSIGYEAFRDCSSLENITLPEGITSIGDYAFYGCSSLTNITLPEGIASIGSYAFYGCSSLTNITLPEGITSIGSWTFSGCSSLTNITLPEGVTSIGDHAFSGCSSLSSITLPEGVTSIGNHAFSGCSSLTSITLPEGVTSISASMFYGCSSLTSITLPEGVISIGAQAFFDCSSLTSITLPKGVTSIGHHAFYGCSSLTSITLPEGVTSIDYYAFSGCSSLTSITLPKGVTSIGDHAFSGCSSLTSITLPEEITSIGHYAFSSCSSFTNITLPEGITSIGSYAFYECSSLTSITLPEGVTSISDWAFFNCSSLTSITLPEGITSIGQYAFSDCSSLTSITLPEGVTLIETSAFEDCGSLTSITLPEGVTSISDWAFFNCSSLTSITLPEGITSIGRSAFYGCSSLTSITLPEGVTSIGSSAFSSRSSLYVVENKSDLPITLDNGSSYGNVTSNAKVLIDKEGNKHYRSGVTEFEYVDTTDNFRFAKENGKYKLIAYLGEEETVTLPRYIQDNDYSIYRMLGVKKVIIPEGVTSIGSSAFHDCRSLTSITLPEGVTSIGSQAFFGCSSLTSITLPEGVTHIGTQAFEGCSSLTSITLPEGVTSIGSRTFYGCSSLKVIYYNAINSTMETSVFVGIGINSEVSVYFGNKVKSIPDNIFANEINVKELIIPNSVQIIGNLAFAGCTSLERLVYHGERDEWRHIEKASSWNDGIGNYQFITNEDTGLLYETDEERKEFYVAGYDGVDTSIHVPTTFSGRKVTKVYAKAFSGAELEEIVLPESIIEIGSNAFAGCKQLKGLIIPNSVVTLQSSILSETPSLEHLTIPFLGSKLEYEEGECLGYLFGALSFEDQSAQIPTSLTNVVVNNAEQIAPRSFYGAQYVESITIPEGVISIGDYAFAGCKNLDSFIIPDSVISMGEMVFEGCYELSYLYIGASFAEIDDYVSENAFFGLDKTKSTLSVYDVSEENEEYATDEFGILYRKMKIPFSSGDRYVLVEILDAPSMANLDGYTMPENIVSIASYAFAYNTSLRMIDLTYVRRIASHAFYRASNLINVTLGKPEFTIFEKEEHDEFTSAIDLEAEQSNEGMWEKKYYQYIGERAFAGCLSLMKIDIDTPNIIGIADFAFSNCPKLTTIILGNGIEYLGLSVFAPGENGVSNVERFSVDENNLHFKSIDGVLYSINSDLSLTLEIFPASAVILDENGEPCYQEGEVIYKDEFVLPTDANIKAIQSYAFQGVKFLKKVIICPEDDLIFGDYALANSGIQNVYIGQNVVSLGLVRGEGEYTVFSGANYLTEIEVDPLNEYYCSEDGVLFNKAQSTLIKYPSAKMGTTYAVPKEVNIISSMAFKGNGNLVEIDVSSYILTIGLEAFYATNSLQSINFNNVYAPISILENAFTTFVKIEEGEVGENAYIGYSLSCYYDGDNGEFGWINYAHTYNLVDVTYGEAPSVPEGADTNNFYAIVVVDTNGNPLGDMLVNLTDGNGRSETIRTTNSEDSKGVAMFYDLLSVEGMGFDIDFEMQYVIEVADPRNIYYTFKSSEIFLDEDMCITYITLERKPCDVTFSANGGVGSIETMDILVDSVYEIPNHLVSRSGYTLSGWSTSPDGVVKYTDTFSTNKYKSHFVLYAIWKANLNTIKFNANGGEGTMASVQLHTDASMTLPNNTFTKDGYTLVGWSTTPTGSVEYADGVSYTSGPESEYALYAIWTSNENTIVFNANGGIGVMEEVSVFTDAEYTLPTNNFTRAGYTFSHWVDSVGNKYTKGSKYLVTGKPIQTLKAIWTANLNTINFNANGGRGTMSSITGRTDSTIVLPKCDFIRSGYVIIGWATSPKGKVAYGNVSKYKVTSASQTTLYAVWAKGAIAYGVSCDSADINTQTLDLNKAQYDYSCWMKGSHSHDYDGLVCRNGKIYENVLVGVTVYFDSDFGYSFVNSDGTSLYSSQTGLYQNGVRVAEFAYGEINKTTTILYFNMPVNALAEEVQIVAKLEAVNDYGEITACETALNIHVFDFSINEKDVNVETDSLNVDLKKAGGDLIKLLGLNSFEFSIGKNTNVGLDIDGSYLTAWLSTGFSKGNSYNSYKEGYDRNHGAHNKNTYFFQYHAIILDSKNIPHYYTYNIRFARNTQMQGYYYYRCYIYEGGIYENEVSTFYGVVNESILGKDLRSRAKVKAAMIYFTHLTSAKRVKDLDKIKKLGAEAQYCEQIKNAPQKQSKWGFNVALDGNIVFKYSRHSLIEPVSSSIKGTVSFTYQYNADFVVWIIPITLEVKVGFTGTISLELKFDEHWQGVDIDSARLTMEASITASAGIGCRIASLGIYGRIGMIFVLDFAPDFGVDKLNINGEIGIYGKFLWWKFNIPLWKGNKDIIKQRNGKNALTHYLASVYLAENYSLASPDELEGDFELVVIDGEVYKVGFIDATEYSGYDEYNYAKLAISKWNGDGWSEPIIIDDNGKNDGSYAVCMDGDDLILVFTQQTKTMVSEDDTYDSASNLALKTLKLNKSTIEALDGGKGLSAIIERDNYMYFAQYVLVDQIPTLVWAENADNNIFGVSPDNYIDENGESHIFATSANSIWVSRYVNGEWTQPYCVVEGLSTITDLAINVDGVVAYIIDTNGDLSDDHDRILYYGELFDSHYAVNDKNVGSVITVKASGEDLIYYYDALEGEDGYLYLSVDSNSEKQLLPNVAGVHDAVILRDENGNIKAFIYYTNKTWDNNGNSETGSGVYGVFYQDGVWGEVVELSDYTPKGDRYISKLDAVLCSDGSIMISVFTNDDKGLNYETEDVVVIPKVSFEILDTEIDYENQTLAFTIKNSGEKHGCAYVIVDEEITLLDETILSGASNTYTISLHGNVTNNYTVKIADNSTGQSAILVENVDLNYSDIQPFAKQLLIGNNNLLLLAVKNTGNLSNVATTIMHIGKKKVEEIITAEVVSAIESASLVKGVPSIITYVNEDGETENLWVVRDEVDAGKIIYHEINLAGFGNIADEGIVSIGSQANLDLEKGVAANNNYSYAGYSEFIGVVEEGESVISAPKLLEEKVLFDNQNEEAITFEYTSPNDVKIKELYIDGELISEGYEDNKTGACGVVALSYELLKELDDGEHELVVLFDDNTECELVVEVIKYYTITWYGAKQSETTLAREGRIPETEFIPQKEEDVENTYAFIGWSLTPDATEAQKLMSADKDTAYYAVWNVEKRKYTITWVLTKEDGSTIDINETYSYGDQPCYNGTIFVPDEMIFASWDKDVTLVTGDATYTALYEDEYVIGDVNGDRIINTRDLAMLRQYVVGKIVLTEEQLKRCNLNNDYNEDGTAIINTRDVAVLQQYIVGLIELE